MQPTSRRDLVRAFGAILPAGALIGAAASRPAAAQPVGSSGALDEERAQRIIGTVKPAVVLLEVETESGMVWGSGFYVSSDGVLITNRQVVKDAQKVTCLHRNKEKLPARVLKLDPQYDLAVVKVELKSPAPTVTLGDSDDLKEGLLVAATGYPATRTLVWLGMAVDSSTSRGCINAQRYGGDVNTYYGDRVVQIDAPITHGNHGGPVVRLDTGEAVGVVTGGSGNMTFAVPINQAKVLVAGIGQKLTPRPLAADSPEMAMETGDLRLLNTISVSKELPRLFAFPFEFQRQFRANTEPVLDWTNAAGQAPAEVTPLVLEGDDLFFGATDGRLRQWKLDAMFEPPFVLLDTGRDSIFVDPPVATRDIVVTAGGALELTQKEVSKVTAGSVLKGIASLGLLGGSEESTVRRIEGRGSLVGLNRRNGNIDWAIETGWLGTPALYVDRVYYGGMGERGCVDALQGKHFWKFEARKGPQGEYFHIGYAGSLGILGLALPLEVKEVKGGVVTIVGDGKVRLEKYDLGTGKVEWKTSFGDLKDRRRCMGAAMFVDEGKGLVYALAGQIVAAMDGRTGKLMWAYDHAKATEELLKKARDKKVATVSFSAQMAIHEGVIYVGSEDRKLYAFNGEDGRVLWTYNTRGAVGHPFYYEGQVLVGSSDGYIHAVDARAGTLVWRVLTRGAVRSQPLVRQGMVFAATDDGEIQTVRIPLA